MNINQFGGSWTEAKMEIVVSYAKAYLTIMQKQSWAKTIYFDGFAGSGVIADEEKDEIKKGTALRILDITEPKSFDIYYFVELNSEHKTELDERVQKNYFGRNAHVVQADCNDKLLSMVEFLKTNKSYRALAFIDPYGMSVKWTSIESLKNLGVDLWMLIPTGIGVNRLLKKDGNIQESWLKKLELFLGIDRAEINKLFYSTYSVHSLFENQAQTFHIKQGNAIEKIHKLYKERLLSVFKYVSDAFVLRNSTNSIMYHFLMATNNTSALRIANDIVKPKYKL